MRSDTEWADYFRITILILASVFAGTSAWVILKTNYTSAKVMLGGILCITAGHFEAARNSLGSPSPGWVYLVGTPLGYLIALRALALWKRERGVMPHDPDFCHEHGKIWHWFTKMSSQLPW